MINQSFWHFINKPEDDNSIHWLNWSRAYSEYSDQNVCRLSVSKWCIKITKEKSFRVWRESTWLPWPPLQQNSWMPNMGTQTTWRPRNTYTHTFVIKYKVYFWGCVWAFIKTRDHKGVSPLLTPAILLIFREDLLKRSLICWSKQSFDWSLCSMKQSSGCPADTVSRPTARWVWCPPASYCRCNLAHS